LTLPRFKPLELIEQASAFDHPDFIIFEPKYDGFRSLALIENSRTHFVQQPDHASRGTTRPSRSRSRVRMVKPVMAG
jgi:hypothetical protein